MSLETILALTLLCGGGWGIFCWLPKRKRRNRRVSSAWPRKGTVAPNGYFADSAKRPTVECAGKVG